MRFPWMIVNSSFLMAESYLKYLSESVLAVVWSLQFTHSHWLLIVGDCRRTIQIVSFGFFATTKKYPGRP